MVSFATVLDAFGRYIFDTCMSGVTGVGIDVEREERLNKCLGCHKSFAKVRFRRTSRPGAKRRCFMNNCSATVPMQVSNATNISVACFDRRSLQTKWSSSHLTASRVRKMSASAAACNSWAWSTSTTPGPRGPQSASRVCSQDIEWAITKGFSFPKLYKYYISG